MLKYLLCIFLGITNLSAMVNEDPSPLLTPIYYREIFLPDESESTAPIIYINIANPNELSRIEENPSFIESFSPFPTPNPSPTHEGIIHIIQGLEVIQVDNIFYYNRPPHNSIFDEFILNTEIIFDEVDSSEDYPEIIDIGPSEEALKYLSDLFNRPYGIPVS